MLFADPTIGLGIVSLNLNLNLIAYSVRLPQFCRKAKTPAISWDQGSISKYLFLGFGASWVPPHSASIVSAGEKNLGLVGVSTMCGIMCGMRTLRVKYAH